MRLIATILLLRENDGSWFSSPQDDDKASSTSSLKKTLPPPQVREERYGNSGLFYVTEPLRCDMDPRFAERFAKRGDNVDARTALEYGVTFGVSAERFEASVSEVFLVREGC